jgi:transcriptional regulator GlxA family with amidase domain
MIAKVGGTSRRPVRAASEGRGRKILQLVTSGAAYWVCDLARQVQLSPSHLRRLFKRETGVRLGAWLTEQRLQRAAQLLRHSYLSVKEITHAVGYEHVSSFTRAFERRFGDSPRRYRKRASGHGGAPKAKHGRSHY